MAMNLQSIMRGIGVALTYDDQGNFTAANNEYLKNIVIIASYLQTNSPSEAETTRLYKLARQCLDRSEEISKQQHKAPTVQEPVSQPPKVEQHQPTTTTETPSTTSSALEEPFLQARAKNKLLYENYLHKVNKIKSQFAHNPRQMQFELSTLNLSYIREYTENISIAKDKHDKMISMLEQKKKQDKLGNAINKIAKRKSPLYLLPPLIKQRDKQWRKSLLKDTDNRATIQEHFSQILTDHKHYLGKQVEEFIVAWKYKSAVDIVSLDSHKGEILSFFDRLKGIIFEKFPELRAPENEAVTISVIEEILFPKIYGNLFEMYKIKSKYAREDELLQKQCNQFKSVTPQQIGIEDHLCLEGIFEPYREAIQELHTLCFRLTPYNKLQCLVSVSRNIVSCAEKYFSMIGDSKKHVIGADQLLPIMTFVVIKADLPNAMSECNFLSDFIDEKSMAGELGYTLASFQTCLMYVSNMTWNDIQDKSPEPSQTVEEELVSSPPADSFPMPPPGPPPAEFPLFPEPPAYKPTTAFPAPPSGPPPQNFPDLIQFPDPPSGPPPPYPTEPQDVDVPEFDPDILEDIENVVLDEDEERLLAEEFAKLK